MRPGVTTRRAALALLLCAATVAAYAQVVRFDFVNLDDNAYVAENPRVLDGMTRDGLAWALTTSSQANWHPLTWISLQLDAERGGRDAGVYHATNLALHLL